MNLFKRRIAAILAAGLVLTSLPLTGSPVNAEILPELAGAVDVPDTAEADYSEGDVIVCLNTGENQSPGLVANDRAGVIAGLLNEAEDLMDVTGAVKESEELPEGDNTVTNDKAASDEEYTLKYIHSDEYSTDQLIEMLKSDPDVLFAEPNYIHYLADEIDEDMPVVYEEADKILTEDPEIGDDAEIIIADHEDAPVADMDGATVKPTDLTGLQYAYRNGKGGMDVPDWNTKDYKNAENTVVAVMDTGVDYDHEDLYEVMWDEGLLYPELTKLGGGKYGYTGIEENAKGVPYHSYDPMDDHSHGTHCAGSVGAAWNGYGVSGTANGTKIMAVKAANNSGGFPTYAVLKCYNYIKTAKEAGVNVVAVNNSWGGGLESCAEQLAVRELTAVNVVSCFASGNDNTNNDRVYKTTTLLREDEGVIRVNSNDEAGKRSSFSNYGIRITDLSSPGSEIMSTVPTGFGPPDPEQCAPVKDVDEVEAKDDFKDEDIYFTYTVFNGATGSIVKDEGSRVLAIDNIPEKGVFLTLSSDRALKERPEYFAIKSKFDIDTTFAIIPEVLCNDGEFRECKSESYLGDFYSCRDVYSLPEDMNIETPVIRLNPFFDPKTGRVNGTMYIKGISFTNERTNYNFESGTSMATPAVTGEVAVVAAKWPKDSAKRRAARIIGSASYRADLDNTNRTGGIANVRGALDCDYSPVVNKAWLDEAGKLNISGFFFGNGKGTVSVLEGDSVLTDISIDEWTGQDPAGWSKAENEEDNREDIIKLSKGSGTWPENEIKVTVTTTGAKEGSRIMMIRGLDGSVLEETYYEPLYVPTSKDKDIYDDFMNTAFFNGAALSGNIYYSATDGKKSSNEYVLWRYSLSGNGNASQWSKLRTDVHAAGKSNLCPYNGTFIYLDGVNNAFRIYSPEDDMIYDAGFTIEGISDMTYSSAFMVNVENRLFLLLTLQKYDEKNEKYVDDKTVLYLIDTDNKRAVDLDFTLKSLQKFPVLAGETDESGNYIIYALSGKDKDDTHIVAEKITVSTESVTSIVNETELPASCHLDEHVLMGVPTQYGIVLVGPEVSDNKADNFLYSPEDGTITACKRRMAPGRSAATCITEYKGKTYFLVYDMYGEDGVNLVYADNDEFRGSGEVKPPLHYYGDDKVEGPARKSAIVTLTPAADGSVAVGKKLKITPEVTSFNGKTISYTWYSADTEIATVDQKGTVTGKTNGTTNINAIGWDPDGNIYRGQCEITVYSKITGLKLDAKKLTVESGSTFRLNATVTPYDDINNNIEWTVSTPKSLLGVVFKTGEGRDNDGFYANFKADNVSDQIQVKITAKTTDGSNKSASCTVTVKKVEGGEELVPLKSAAFSDAGTIYIGEDMTYDISLVRVKPDNCGGYTVEWKSSNKSAVTVSGNEADFDKATINGVSKGTAKITAVITNTAQGGKKTVTVKGLTVKVVNSALSGNDIRIFNKKKDITWTTSGNRLAVGKKLTLKAPVYMDGNELKASKVKVLWTSSEPEIATVVNGKMKAYREGETKIIATLIPNDPADEIINVSCMFYVYNPIEKLQINRAIYENDAIRVMQANVKKMSLASGAESILTPKPTVALPAGSDDVREDKDYEWTSSNTNVVEILEGPEGCVTLSANAAGKAVITCKAMDGSNKKAKCTVTVYDRVTGITLSVKKPGALTVSGNNTDYMTVSGLANKKTFKITPNLQPGTAKNKSVIYTSENPAAITVSKKGVVKRVGAGSANIFVTTADGGYTAVCYVDD